MEDRKVTIQKNLKRFLAEKGMTQAQLSQKTDISPQQISRYIKGASFPDLATIIALSDGLGISVDSLVGRDIAPSFEKKEQTAAELLKELVSVCDRIGIKLSFTEAINTAGGIIGPRATLEFACQGLVAGKGFHAIGVEDDVAEVFSDWVKFRDLLQEKRITNDNYHDLMNGSIDRRLSGYGVISPEEGEAPDNG